MDFPSGISGETADRKVNSIKESTDVFHDNSCVVLGSS